MEADLPLNSGNCEDEDLVERPLRFAAAHKPPLPEVLEFREPEKRLGIRLGNNKILNLELPEP